MSEKGVKSIQNQSVQDYLEEILILSNKKETVKAKDIVNSLNYSKASVSIALKKLKEEKYIEIDDTNNITLTSQGKIIAEKTLEKHRVLTAVLVNLGVEKEIAEEDACAIEHIISEESFNALKEKLYEKK